MDAIFEYFSPSLESAGSWLGLGNLGAIGVDQEMLLFEILGSWAHRGDPGLQLTMLALSLLPRSSALI